MFSLNNISENSLLPTPKVIVNIEDIFSDFTEGNLLKKCRLCFNSVESEYKQTKITEHYKHLINIMLEIQFIPTSRTSDFLCQSCVFNVRSFHQFKMEMKDKQLCFRSFLNNNNDLNHFVESNSTNDSNSVFIKTEPEEIPSMLLPSTAELFPEFLFNDHPYETEFKTESPSDDTTENDINSASDKRQSIELSKIFPHNEKYQKIIEIYLENPHHSKSEIARYVGLTLPTVNWAIRKYKVIENEINAASKNGYFFDSTKLFPRKERHQKIIDAYLTEPQPTIYRISKNLGIPKSTIVYVIRKYKSLVSNTEETNENSKIAPQMSEKLLKGDQCYSSSREIIHDRKKSKGQIQKKVKIKTFKCEDCDKTFCTRSQVKQHSLVHRIKPKPDSSAKEDKVHMMTNENNSVSDNGRSNYPSKLFPIKERYQRIIDVYSSDPNISSYKISKLFGLPRTTVRDVLRRYIWMVSNNKKPRENCENSASQISEKVVENGQCHSSAMNCASDNTQIIDPSNIFPGNTNRQRTIDIYLKSPNISLKEISYLVGVTQGAVERTILKYKSIVSKSEKTLEDREYYPCQICGKLLKGELGASLHVQRVHENKKFRQCDICGRRFKFKTDLKLHMPVHIPKEFRIKSFQCDHCDNSFENKQLIKRHLFVHHMKFKPYSCDLCGKSFSLKDILLSHRNTHNKKNIQCDYPDCEKMFKDNKSMLKHKTVHIKELHVECPYEDCHKSYAKKKNLDLHIFVNHKKIREKCPVGNGCKFSVGRRDYMKAHLKKHSELSAGELEKYFKQLSTMNLYTK